MMNIKRLALFSLLISTCLVGCAALAFECEHTGGEATCLHPAECELCGKYYGEAKGHDLMEMAEKAADCVNEGYSTHWACQIEGCGYTVGKTVFSATGHTYSAVITEATCLEGGYTTYICDCGYEYVNDYTEALSHDIVTLSAVDATCTQSGLSAGEYCTRCDYKKEQEPEDALGHDIIILEAKTPTCSESGLTQGEYCSRCDYRVDQNLIKTLGHTECVDFATLPDCVNTGLTEGKHCFVCGEVLVAQVIIEALGHTAGEAVVENNVLPDCTVCGSFDTVIYCSVCNEELVRKSVSVEALGHQEVTDEAVAPTCTQAGISEGRRCSVCGAVTSEQTVIEATGHNWTDATCSSPKTCSICGAQEGSALEHQYIDGVCSCGKTSGDEPLENVNFQFSLENRVSLTSEQQVWAFGGLTFINDKSESEKDVADYSSPVRCYQGSKITVKGSGIYVLTFVCYSSNYASNLKKSITNDGYDVTIIGSMVTVAFKNPVDSFVIESLIAQARINSVRVNDD